MMNLGLLYWKVKSFFLKKHALHMSKQSIINREKFNEKILNLPRIEAGEEDTSLELHMFCGKSQLDMGIISSWSIKRYFKNNKLLIHSDGTLDESDMEKWRGVIADVEFTSKNERKKVVNNSFISGYKHLCKWKESNWVSAKLIDIHFMGKSNNILLFDSDTLYFSEPHELIKAAKVTKSVMRWNQDLKSSYCAKKSDLDDLLKIDMPEKFNSGILLVSRLKDRKYFEFIDNVISNIDERSEIDAFHVWSEQSYYAIISSLIEDKAPLREGVYGVYYGSTRPDTIARHYVGDTQIRPRFFNEGVPRIMSELSHSTS